VAVTLAASFGFALVQLDVTIINVALPAIARSLQCGVSGLQWVVDAYALTFAVLLLTCGALADRFGAKRVYLIGLGLFAGASVLCGLAPNAELLIAARVLQGVAAPAMLPSSLSLLNHATAYDSGLRARAIGWWTASGSITIAAGPILGGLLVATAGWRSIFLVNLPLCAIGAFLTWRTAEPTRAAAPAGAPNRGLDLPGQLLAILGLVAFAATVIEARRFGFDHPLIITGVVVTAIAWPLFVWVEATSPAPMLPLQIFRAPGFTPAVLYGVAVNFTYYGVVFVLSLYLQRVLGYTALQAGIAYLPLTATFFGVNVLSGRLIAKFGVRTPMVLGALIDAFGFSLLLSLGEGSSYWQMLPAFALIPAGMGTGVPAMTTTVLSSVDKARTGVAAGVLNAARQAAGVMGVALFGALAGDGRENVVRGLHGAATICVLALLMAASLVFHRIAPPARSTARSTAPEY
jgi:DHA2 family methylenomycin A resistance protein-like MFS transporter